MRTFCKIILLMLIVYVNLTHQKDSFFLTSRNVNNALQLVIVNLTQCDGHENLPVYVQPMDIIQEGRNDYFIKGNILFKENFTNGFKVSIDAKNCDTADLDSCTDIFNNFRVGDLCRLLAWEQASYTPFLSSVKPPLKCPLYKGIYNIDKLPVDDAVLRHLPPRPCHFRVKVYGHLKDKLVSCFYLGVYTRSKRLRN